MRSKPLILASLLVAAFSISLETTMVNVALPVLVRELHASTNQLQWVVDAYNLVFAALLLTAGSLSDRFGRKGMLLAGLAVFGTASLVGGLATSPGALIAARAVMGVGAAMTFPATLSLLTNTFAGRDERALAIGLWGAATGVAIAIGPIAGGFLLGHYSWGSIFFAMVPVAALGIWVIALSVPTSRDPDSQAIDIPGFLLSTGFMALIVYTIIEAPSYGWGAGRTIAGFVGAMVLLGAFIVAESRSDHPMLDVAIFSNLRFSAASASVTIVLFTLFGFIFLVIQYMQIIRGWSPLSAGVHILPVAITVAVGSVAGTRLAVKVGTKVIVAVGLAAMAGFYVWTAFTLTPTTSYGLIAAQMVVLGLGMGLAQSPATDSIMGAVSLGKAGVGSAVNDATRQLGGTLGVAAIGSVYASIYSSQLARHLPSLLPTRYAATAHQSVGAALAVASRITALGHPVLGAAVHHAATNAFIDGINAGCYVAAGVAAAGVALAVAFLPSQPPTAVFKGVATNPVGRDVVEPAGVV